MGCCLLSDSKSSISLNVRATKSWYRSFSRIARSPGDGIIISSKEGNHKMQCRECERYEKHQIHAGRIEGEARIQGRQAEADRASDLWISIVQRLKDHQAVDHDPGGVY